MLDITLRGWALQTTQYSWAYFTVFVYKADKCRRDTAATTGSAGFYANFHSITSEDVHFPPSMATTATSDISELASAFSSAADAQIAQITASMAEMTDHRLPGNTKKARRTGARQGRNQRGKKTEKKKSYCWTHGVTTNMEHKSGTCENQHTDHQDAANFDNHMGGSEHICRSGQNPCGPGPAN